MVKMTKLYFLKINFVFRPYFLLEGLTIYMGSIARMDPKLTSKCRDVSWPSLPTPSSCQNRFSKVIGLNPHPLSFNPALRLIVIQNI